MITEEKNNLYICHFCQQNIDLHDIEKHFTTFHKFRSSIEREYVCEFCDDFEEFNLLTNVDTLEEGKLRFLQLILNFNSQFNLL